MNKVNAKTKFPATGNWGYRTSYAVVLLLCMLVLVNSCSSNLFYLPASYSTPYHYRLLRDSSIVHLHYNLEEKRQTAFYLGDFKAQLPRQVWVLFGGISSLALDWHQWFAQEAGGGIGFLLIDYPGYGLNEGVPREEKMVQSGIAATTVLFDLFGTTRENAPFLLNAMGHSLGSGVAIHYADRIPVDRLLLIAPFTNMDELVRFRYGWFRGALVSLINPERFNNRETLAKLLERKPPPEVVIIHGAKDAVIPVVMGENLAKTAGDAATLFVLPEMGHRDMFAKQNALITKILKQPCWEVP